MPTSISVMLIVPDAEAAVRWYTMTLGADTLWDLHGVAGFELDGAPFFIHEAVGGRKREPSPTDIGATTVRIEVFVDDPAALIERAARGGATRSSAPSTTRRRGGRTCRVGSPIRSATAGRSGTAPPRGRGRRMKLSSSA